MYRIELNSEIVPKKWYSINAELPYDLPEPKNSEGKDQLSSLKKVFTKAALEQENSKKRYITMPRSSRTLYDEWPSVSII